jgi:hypothetical protein
MPQPQGGANPAAEKAEEPEGIEKNFGKPRLSFRYEDRQFWILIKMESELVAHCMGEGGKGQKAHRDNFAKFVQGHNHPALARFPAWAPKGFELKLDASFEDNFEVLVTMAQGEQLQQASQ